jgi:circadian clock protein KaiC
MVNKMPTGIRGFDTMLEGGIPEGRVLLITGSAGTGKTVLLNEFLYRGITEYGENGVFVTFEEQPSEIAANVGSFGWDYTQLQAEGKLLFADFSPLRDNYEEVSDDYDLTPIMLRIRQAVEKIGARRVVLDSVASLFSQLSNKNRIRRYIFQMCQDLKEMGITSLISSEQPDSGTATAGYAVEEFVSDGVIQMRIAPGEQQLVRTMLVTKMRGVGYRSGYVQFNIGSEGLCVFPKIAVRRGMANTSFEERKRFGISGLDQALDGGIPKGHIVLISGTTGSGKSLSGIQFLEEGIRNGERAVFVALEEPVQQIKKTAEVHGWNLDEHEERGELRFVTAELIDPMPDELLSNIVEAVEEIGAGRLVFDSISSLMSATMHQEQVRQFLLQLANYIKYKGLTGIFSYLMSSNFGADKDQLLGALETNNMRLSSVVDGVILLQYVERQQRVEKVLNVLKMRGCRHSRDLFQYEIEVGGLRIGEKFSVSR